jgi:glycosyltransferase involved in cell wall biosynthesis
MMGFMTLSIVIPFHNEEKNVGSTIKKLYSFFKSHKLKGEIIAVDDRSADSTGRILDSLSKKYGILKVLHRKGDSHDVEVGYAIRDGINAAKYDIVTIMMGDLSDNPNDILKMIKKINEGYDIVCGSRFIKGSRLVDYPLMKYLMVRIYNFTFPVIFGLKVKDFSNAFKSYRGDVFKKVKLESKEFEITAEMLLKAHIYGYKITEVPVSWVNRKSGESKLGTFNLSFQFLFLKLPRIGFRYGMVALKLYFIYLISRLTKILG